MTNGKRDYQKQQKYDGKPSVKKNRAQRNKAHRMMEDKVGHKIHTDIGHKKAMGKGGKSTLANLFVQSVSSNRSFARNRDGSMRSERSKKERGYR
jgi:hypothetical protein